MKKLVRISAAGTKNYPFDGWDSLILVVTKITKNKIYGRDTYMKGNQTRESWNGKLGERWVINKNEILGWKELE